MPSETITALTSDDPDFYPLIGPFLANRDVFRAVGDKIWDDPGKTWLVARGPHGTVTGFIGVRTARGGLTQFESCYTVEADSALARRLVQDALDRISPSPAAAVVLRGPMLEAYLAAGFTEVGEGTVRFAKIAHRGA